MSRDKLTISKIDGDDGIGGNDGLPIDEFFPTYKRVAKKPVSDEQLDVPSHMFLPRGPNSKNLSNSKSAEAEDFEAYSKHRKNESACIVDLRSYHVKPTELNRYYQAVKLLRELQSTSQGIEIYKIVEHLEDNDVSLYTHNFNKGVMLPSVEEALVIFRGGLSVTNVKKEAGFLLVPFTVRDRPYQLNICIEEKFGTYVSLPGSIDDIHRSAHTVRDRKRSDFAVTIASLIGKSKKGRERQVCPPVQFGNMHFSAVLSGTAKKILSRFENLVLTFDEYKRIINDCLAAYKLSTYPDPGAVPGFKNGEGKYDRSVAREFIRSHITCTYIEAESIPIFQLSDYIHENLAVENGDYFVREVAKAMRKHTILDDYHFKDSTLISTCRGVSVKAQQVSIKHSKIATYLANHLDTIYDEEARAAVAIDYYGLGMRTDGKESPYADNYGARTFIMVMRDRGYLGVKLHNNIGPDNIVFGDEIYPVVKSDLNNYIPKKGSILVSDVMFADPTNKYLLTNSIHTALMMECLNVGAICVVKLIRSLLKFDCSWVAFGRNHNAEGFATTIGMKVQDGKVQGLKAKKPTVDYYVPYAEGNVLDVSMFYRNKFVVVEEKVEYQVVRSGAVHGGVVWLNTTDGGKISLDQKRVEKAMKNLSFLSTGVLIVDNTPIVVALNRAELALLDPKLEFGQIKDRKIQINFDQ